MRIEDLAGFYLAGLLNNSGYVIMLAGAKSIAPSYVGVVYVCNVVPAITVKLTGPYWYHYISYRNRMILSAVLMSFSFIMVALGTTANALWLQLLGVIIGSIQSGFGEASFLALTAFFDSRKALTAWSSGTGLAGIFGYAWVVIFTIGLKANFQLTLYAALILPLLFLLNFFYLIKIPLLKREADSGLSDPLTATDAEREALDRERAGVSLHGHQYSNNSKNNSNGQDAHADAEAGSRDTDGIMSNVVGGSSSELCTVNSSTDEDSSDLSTAAGTMTGAERLKNTLALWPFMTPLFVVYFAEYAMQAGVWSAIGFPVSSENARNNFYEWSNFMYQGGVLISRSSGLVYKADMKALWAMPVLQVSLLIFFLLDAYYMFWYDWSLLMACFVVGLLGGGVYVGGFSLLAETVPPHLKEFSLSAASLADSVGIALSTVAGIFIQQALYRYHHIDDN